MTDDDILRSIEPTTVTDEQIEEIEREIREFKKTHEGLSIEFMKAVNGVYFKLKQDPNITGYVVGSYFPASSLKIVKKSIRHPVAIELDSLRSLLMKGIKKRLKSEEKPD